jgi:uncharacterized coiled-coil DUF342 family protein
MSKPKSPAALAREIERLNAQVEALKADVTRHLRAYGELLGEVVDLRTQRDQVVRILTGVDE